MTDQEKIKCPFPRLRDYPGCFEDCDYGDTDTCPHHKYPEPKVDTELLREGYLEMAKPDERLLTDEEIKSIIKDIQNPITDRWLNIIRKGIKAQLAIDHEHEQERLESIKREIENNFSSVGEFKVLVIHKDEAWWQEFWKQEGIK